MAITRETTSQRADIYRTWPKEQLISYILEVTEKNQILRDAVTIAKNEIKSLKTDIKEYRDIVRCQFCTERTHGSKQ